MNAAAIAQQNDEPVAAVLLSSRHVCRRCLHAPACSSKDIQFPRSRKAALKIVVFDWDDDGRFLRPGWHDDSLAIAGGRGRSVDGRKITRTSDASCCSSFLYTFESQHEVQVLFGGPLDQCIELRVLERRPPVIFLNWCRGGFARCGNRPLSLRRNFWPPVVWPNRAASQQER